MSELPVDIIYDSLSRLPVKSLDRFRCVCKDWCKYIDEPNLAIIQMNGAVEEPILILSKRLGHDPGPNLRQKLTLFGVIKSKEGNTSPEAKKSSLLEFKNNIAPFPNIHRVRGSCNGLLYLSKNDNYFETTYSVIHPLRNERYELPPILSMKSCGLGFDAYTNTFKMCVSVQKNYKTLHTMVHVLGTDSWREIPQIPYYLMMGDGKFAHGCLHWLGYHNQMPDASWSGYVRHFPPTHRFKVICFDVRKEEFGLIDPPRKTGDDWFESNLVDLHGEIGFVYRSFNSYSCLELWVLKQDQWVIQCRLDPKPPFPCDLMDNIVGLWNKSGDILVTADFGKLLFVYRLKSRSFHQVNLVGREDAGCEALTRMYRSSIFSVRGLPKTRRRRSRKRKRKLSIPSKVIYRFLKFW